MSGIPSDGEVLFWIIAGIIGLVSLIAIVAAAKADERNYVSWIRDREW